MTKSTKPASSFRESLKELETITQALESDNVDLDEALKHFERGTELAAQLQAELKAAELKIEKIKGQFQAPPPPVPEEPDLTASTE